MKRFLPLIDAALVLALMSYVLAGVRIVPFHGDEPMHIYMSGDYETAFVDGRASSLASQAPYHFESDPYFRLMNGSVTRYLIGFARQFMGIPRDQLPPQPGWDWGADYQRNVETGHLPTEALLLTGRMTSALLAALSVPLLFALGTLIGGRRTGYPAAVLYALNPIVLLNGRRALQEGALLFFGLAVVLVAAAIARRRRDGRPVRFLWLLFAATGALALASKHSALPFVIGALAWIPLAEATHFQRPAFLAACCASLACAALMFAGFVTLSPALWNDPPARLANLIDARRQLLEIQVGLSAHGATTPAERLDGLVTQPFATPPQFFEVQSWASCVPVRQQIDRYLASPLSGYPAGGVLGALLTLAMLAGALILCVPRWRPCCDAGSALGLAAWTAAMAVSLLVNPLDWQRYALGLIPEAALLAAVTCAAAARWFRARQPAARC